jgi:hypothetical protein
LDRYGVLFLFFFWAKLVFLDHAYVLFNLVCLQASYPNECFAGLGHSTPGWSEEERLKFPCPGRHCEEGTYQDSWFLSNRRVRSKPCMQSSYISGVEHIRLCKSRPTPVRSTIHIKPSHLSACMLVTIVSNPVRGSIVRWFVFLS